MDKKDKEREDPLTSPKKAKSNGNKNRRRREVKQQGRKGNLVLTAGH